ncbi:MAG: hypothetical protein JWQ94_2291 [Tardiphaga sp.]|nr:hypothetical protein [Tardiphaga sp.]
MIDAIDELFLSNHASTLCLGETQRLRLLRLMQRYGTPVLWDGESTVTAPGVVVFVMHSTTPTKIDALVGALHENSIVVLPFGENPIFDFFKSRLKPYGSIGSQGAGAPHHVWWGGLKPLAVPTGMYRKEDTLFVSSVGSVVDGAYPGQLAMDMKRLNLDFALDLPGRRTGGLAKVNFIIAQWEQTSRPVFWIDPGASVRQHPLLPQALQCDFAVHKSPSGEMQPGALFFQQTEPARALLDVWQRLSRAYPDLPEAFLLDQAWTLASAQRQIETAWLPGGYWKPGRPDIRDEHAVIQYDPAGIRLQPEEYLTWRCQRARRFGRHQAPEAHLMMAGTTRTRGSITVLLRDVLASDAAAVGGAIEAVAQAFAHDSAGFAQMELVLCAWDEDVDMVMQIEDDSWVLLTDPSERLELDAFSQLDISAPVAGAAAARQIYSAAYRAKPALRLVDPSLAADMKRTGKYPAALLKRPFAMTLD